MHRREFVVGVAAVAVVVAVPAKAAPVVERLIGPCILRCEQYTVSVKDNTRTLRYRWMDRWTIEDGKLITIELAEVGTERYAQWLREDYKDYGHPPHICFGGCVVPNPKGDPEFHARWLAYAKTLS